MAMALTLGLTACGGAETTDVSQDTVVETTESDEAEESGEVEETSNIIHLHENWNFTSGMTPLPIAENSDGTYGIRFFLPNMYETLIEYVDGEYKGNLADSWEISEDGKTYTFKLKDGVKFSDGEDFNAEAVKLNFEATPVILGDFLTGYGKTPTNIESVNVIDDLTVELNLIEPYYGTLHDLTFLVSMSMLSPNAYNEDLTFADATVNASFGTGAYMYEGAFDGTTYEFVRNSHYHNDAPDADGFTVTIIEDDASAVLALRSGELSMISGNTNLTSDVLNEFTNNSDYSIGIADGYTNTTALVLNPTQTNMTSDKIIRNAMAMAIDRDIIVDTILGEYGETSHRFMYENYPYSSKANASKSLDVDGANILLDEAGYVDGDGDGIREKDGEKISLNLMYISTEATGSDFSLLLQSQFKEIGIEVNISAFDSNTWFTNLKAGEFDITWFGTPAGYDPYMSMGNIHSGSADQRLRYVGMGIEGLDAIVDEMLVETDDARIEELYTEILNIIADQDIVVPVYTPKDMTLYSNDIIGNVDVAGDFSSYNIGKVEID